MHSTVTKQIVVRLLTITFKTTIIMRTLDSNALTSRVKNSKAYEWNSKRRYR